MNTIDVEITHGKIRGARKEGVNIFKGIPYAGRVSGDRRFRRPATLEPWSGVRDALELGAPAIQPSRRNEPEPAEDCLFLNLWTPATDNGKRPERFIASHKMAELWATFARTGKPAAADVPEWPAYTLEERATLRIDTDCTVLRDRFHEELVMWRAIGRL